MTPSQQKYNDMKILGLDIGTTTVSAVVWQDGSIIESVTEKNDSFIQSERTYEKIQDVSYIRHVALGIVERLSFRYPDIERIGVTGQMHGIVYLNKNGEAVSPLYTWQDGRGDEIYKDGSTYAEYLTKVTGYSVATGYGLVTHFYNLKNGAVPENAVTFCTVHDYIAMLLAERTQPVTDTTDAASFGLFDVRNGRFDIEAIKKCSINEKILPQIAEAPVIGRYKDMADVYVAIGDNQASFVGALDGNKNGMLVNIGTGSQFSVYSEKYLESTELETRPFPNGGYLLVGASLCGGRAYALLESFFRQVGDMFGVKVDRVYDAMDKLAEEKVEDIPIVTPLFQGTRKDPSLRGTIEGLSTENFTPQHLIVGMMEGMARELYDMYQSYLSSGGVAVTLYGSGNGLRKNRYLQECFERLFEQPVQICNRPEEAATGAAIFASV